MNKILLFHMIALRVVFMILYISTNKLMESFEECIQFSISFLMLSIAVINFKINF